MFGRRPDGRRTRNIDPIVQVTPYLMPMRCDAMVMLKAELAYEPMMRYIAAQSAKGERITFMNIIIAAYVRAVSKNPEINRYIINRHYYSRTNTTVSFTILKDPQDNDSPETTVKIKFDPTDTIFDVRDRMKIAIEKNRGLEASNFEDKLAKFALRIPGLARALVWLITHLDYHGLIPGALLDELPFHTGMFITNNGSIGLHSVYHHVYNFGSTSMFLGMGAIERKTELDGGQTKIKRYLPIGITVDERVSSGAHYSRFFADMMAGMKDPSILEIPPESVRYDEGCEYHIPKPELREGAGTSGSAE